jgi:hypothetical protein
MTSVFHLKEMLKKPGYYAQLLLDNVQLIGKWYSQNILNQIGTKIVENLYLKNNLLKKK